MRPNPLLLYTFALAVTMPCLLYGQASSGSPVAGTSKSHAAPPPTATHSPSASPGNSKPQPPDEGEMIFHQHCAGCHNAPEGFSPRISGTVVRHMRVRVGLSAHDQEALLRFFNP